MPHPVLAPSREIFPFAPGGMVLRPRALANSELTFAPTSSTNLGISPILRLPSGPIIALPLTLPALAPGGMVHHLGTYADNELLLVPLFNASPGASPLPEPTPRGPFWAPSSPPPPSVLHAPRAAWFLAWSRLQCSIRRAHLAPTLRRISPAPPFDLRVQIRLQMSRVPVSH